MMSATALESTEQSPTTGEIGINVTDDAVVFIIKRHQFDIAPVTFALPFLQLDMIFSQRLAKSIEARAQLQTLSHPQHRGTP